MDVNDRGQVLLDGPAAILDGNTMTPVPFTGGVFFLDEASRVLGHDDASGNTLPEWWLGAGTSASRAARGAAGIAPVNARGLALAAPLAYSPKAIDELGCALLTDKLVHCLSGATFNPGAAMGGVAAPIDMLRNGTVLFASGGTLFLVTRDNHVSRIKYTLPPDMQFAPIRMSDSGAIYGFTTALLRGGTNGIGMLLPR